MKLTATQIEQLYKFTRQHYVYFYDVQTELVDHLANDIEEIWAENPKISFEKARDISFKKFGIFGFMDVIEQKQKAMNKKYWQILLRFTKEWFTLPKIITTALIFLGFWFLLQLPDSKFIILGGLLVLAAVDLFLITKFNRKQKKKKKKEEKTFLLESMIGETRRSNTGLVFINLFNSIHLIRFEFNTLALHWVLLISLIATLLCITMYVVNYVIPEKAEELLMETYPEYKLVK